MGQLMTINLLWHCPPVHQHMQWQENGAPRMAPMPGSMIQAFRLSVLTQGLSALRLMLFCAIGGCLLLLQISTVCPLFWAVWFCPCRSRNSSLAIFSAGQDKADDLLAPGPAPSISSAVVENIQNSVPSHNITTSPEVIALTQNTSANTTAPAALVQNPTANVTAPTAQAGWTCQLSQFTQRKSDSEQVLQQLYVWDEQHACSSNRNLPVLRQ